MARSVVAMCCFLMLLGSLAPAFAGPVISNFTPMSGPVGTKVTVNGSGLGTVTNVTFTGGASAAFVKISAFQLQVTVPAGATTGPITITNSTGPTTSADSFTVTAGISGFTPYGGPIGTSVTINGSNLTGATDVLFGAVSAPGFSVNGAGTQITVTVPDGATTDYITVSHGATSVKSATKFKVLPTITSFTPNLGPVGTVVTITGKNFTNPNVILVRFYDKSALFTIDSDTQITATVPEGARTGIISLTTGAGTVYSKTNYYVADDAAGAQPTVTTVTNGAVGSLITVNGTNFGYSFSTSVTDVMVTFPAFDPSIVPVGVDLDPGTAGIQVYANTVAGTSLKVTVPYGATHGPLTVSNFYGSATSAGNFILTPKITGYTPGSGFPGDDILIEGVGLSAIGAPAVLDPPVVKFFNNQTSLLVTPDTSSPLNQYTRVTARVPAAATTGTVSVQTSASAGGTGVGPIFSVGPRISTVSPLTGLVGSIVTVTGANFVVNGTSIYMYGIVSGNPTWINVSSSLMTAQATNSISFKVPNQANALAVGPIKVVTASGEAISDGSRGGVAAGGNVLAHFVPAGKLPTITNFGNQDPANPGTMLLPEVRVGAAATLVVIEGTNLVPPSNLGTAAYATFNGVTVLGNNASIVYYDSTKVVVPVPAGAATGPIRMVNNYGVSDPTSLDYVVGVPTLTTGVSPTSGPVGTYVTLTGTNFTRQSQVFFTAADGTQSVEVLAANIEWLANTSLRVKVPAGAVSGPVKVQTIAGSATSTQVFNVTEVIPVISDFGNTTGGAKSGIAGTSVTIDGTGFTGATGVYFNTTLAAITSANISNGGTRIVVNAPPAFSAGPLRVFVPGVGTSAPTSASYVPAAPTVTTITPAIGPAGIVVAIAGTNFSTESQVRFTGAGNVPVLGVNTRWLSNVLLWTEVPAGALMPGPVYVTNEATPAPYNVSDVNTWGTASTGTFTPVDGIPVVTAFDDATAPTKMGTSVTVTITGSNFKGATQVLFGGTAVALTAGNISADGTTITVTAPATNATVGPLRVAGPAGTSAPLIDGTSGEPLSYVPALPTLTAVSPVSGPTGQPVTITGSNFTPYSRVFFTGTDALNPDIPATEIQLVSPTSLRVTVPAGASVGAGVANPIKVTNEGGEFISTLAAAKYTVQASAPKITDFGNDADADGVIDAGAVKTGPGGTTIAITGTGFTGVAATGAVKFGTTALTTYTVVDDTTIRATINAALAAGLYQVNVVHATNGTGWSKDFYIVSTTAVPPGPTIATTGLNIQYAHVGTTVTITGTNITPQTKVYFSKSGDTIQKPTNLATNIDYVGATSIKADVPANTITGPVRIVNEAGGSGPSTQWFVPAGAEPEISAISSQIAPNGTRITITGDNFIPTSQVQFTTSTISQAQGAAQSVFWPGNMFVSRNEIRVIVPSGTLPGRIKVVNPTLVTGATSPANVSPTSKLSVLSFIPQGAKPANVTFTPHTGPAGTTVTVTANNMTMDSVVRFSGASGINLTGLNFRLGGAANTALVDVPAGAVPGPITVSNDAGTSPASVLFFVPPDADPVVTSFTPSVGKLGKEITINGNNFAPTSQVQFSSSGNIAAGTVVSVNSAGATFVSRNQIRVPVPSTALAGPIRVNTPTLTPAVGAALTLFGVPSTQSFIPQGARPTVTAISPAYSNLTTSFGAPGTEILVTGSNFTPTSLVKFTGASGLTLVAPKVVWINQASLRVTVHGSAKVGPIMVTNDAGNSEPSNVEFVPLLTTTTAIPTITSFSPASGSGGTVVTVNGTNFTPQTTIGFNTAAVAGNGVNYRYISPTQIQVTAPYGVTTGPLRATNNSQIGYTSAVTASNFTLTTIPQINTITTNGAAEGANVTLAGASFTGATAVMFTSASGNQDLAGTIVGTPTATSIVVTVPVGAKTGPLTVTTPIGTSAPSITHFYPVGATPTVTGVSPTSALPGTVITVNGTGFTPQSYVQFYNAGTGLNVGLSGPANTAYLAPSAFISPTQLRVVVPVGALTGPIKVSTTTTINFSAASASHLVIEDRVPVITALSVYTGATSGAITITGVNLESATAVNFAGGVSSTAFTTNTATSIVTTIPAGAETGPVTVTNAAGTSEPGAVTTAGLTYFVPSGAVPTVTGISPNSAPVGTEVTITGTNFTPTTTVGFTNSTTVLAGGTAQSVWAAGNTFVSPTQIKVIVPSGTLPGPIKVTNAAGFVQTAATIADTKSDPFNFVPADAVPVVTAISPNPAAVGATVTLTGVNFMGVTSVTFTGAAPVTNHTIVNGTSITVPVPADAQSGPITVTNAAATSAPGAITASATAARTDFVLTGSVATVTGISPATGPIGTWVTITGTNFTPLSQVKFNGGAGTAQAVNTIMGSAFVSPTELRYLVPAATSPVASAVTVTVSGANGTSVVSGDTYAVVPGTP